MRSHRRLPSILGAAALAVLWVLFSLLSPSAASADSSALVATAPAAVTSEVNAPINAIFVATGGVPPYRWTSTSPLPSGLTLSPKGVLSGIPQSTISEQYLAFVTDAAGSQTAAAVQLTIGLGPTITPSAIPAAVVGIPTSFTLAATGGTPPYSWSVMSGPLPLGLVLGTNGVLAGIPAAIGTTTTTFQVNDAAGSHASAAIRMTVASSAQSAQGYLVATSTGAVSAFATPGVAVPQTNNDGPATVVALAVDAAGNHYWLTTSRGEVTASASARSFGSVSPKHLSGSIVGIAAKPDGSGYWLASSTGHVYGFGSARSYGSIAPKRLSGSVVGIAAKSDGGGYWLASSTGKVYGFGSARRLARTPNARLAGRVVAIASDPVATGCWVVTNLGRVYGYGGVPTFGSSSRLSAANAAVGLTAAPDGQGYWVLTRTSQVRPFGSASLQPAVERALGGSAVAITGAG